MKVVLRRYRNPGYKPSDDATYEAGNIARRGGSVPKHEHEGREGCGETTRNLSGKTSQGKNHDR